MSEENKPEENKSPDTPLKKETMKVTLKADSGNIPKQTMQVPLKEETVKVTLKEDEEKQPVPKNTLQVPLKKETVRVSLKAGDVDDGQRDKQTHSVPLKKETVRVSLKADPSKTPEGISKNTIQVPLKKETVRVTLKASDATGPQAVSAPLAPAKPTVAAPQPLSSSAPPDTTSIQSAQAPPAPRPVIAPTGPPTAGPPTAGPPTSGPPTAGPAPTVKLSTPGTPAAGGGLPKATVKLSSPTEPLGARPPAAAPQVAMASTSSTSSGGGQIVNILAVASGIAAIVLLAFQLMTATEWLKYDEAGNEIDVQWTKIF